MFVGHLALGFAAKRIDPRPSLGWFVAAVVTLDLLWPIFLLLGLERVSIVQGATAFTPLIFDAYPWSHSLLMSILWGALLGFIAYWRGLSFRTARILAALVISHWVLDFVTHAADMPLWPGDSPKVGLVMWNSIPATLIVEGIMWIVGIGLYLQVRRPVSLAGSVLLWSFILISTLMWASGPWSPLPSDPKALARFALAGWIVIPWTALADRFFKLRKPPDLI